MSNKNPMKFLPPDDPTAVYPIRTVTESEGEQLDLDSDSGELQDAGDAGDAGDGADANDGTPLPKTFEFTDDTTAPRSTPLPATRAPAGDRGGLNPLLLVAFLGGGIILAALVLFALAAVLFFLQ